MSDRTILPAQTSGRMVLGTALVLLAAVLSLTRSAGHAPCMVGIGLGLGVIASAVLPVGMDVSLGRYDPKRIGCYYLGLACLMLALALPSVAIATVMIGD